MAISLWFGDRDTRKTYWRRLAFEWRRIRQKSLATLLGKAGLKLLGVGIGLLMLPLTVLLHLAGFRRVTVFAERVGHLALEPDCLLKEQALGLVPKRKWILLAPRGRVANEHLLAYWEPHLRVVRNRAACFLIASQSRWGLMRHHVGHYALAIGEAQAAYRICAAWGERPPLLSLSAEDEAWAGAMLGRLGLPPGAWFACVHAREAGFSPVDEELQSHRNCRIENTFAAMQEIVSRGGWVIRIGDPTMRPLPPMAGIIDYAHSPLKSPRLDVILCARARFILGNTSGIALVGTVFGVPCALSNLIPVSTLWFGSRDLSIPKLLWSRRLARYLRIDEMLAGPIANYHYASLYAEEEVDPVENSAQDILGLVVEMLDCLAGRSASEAGDAELLAYVHSQFKPRHYGFGSAARMAVSFLRRHPELLPPPSDSTGGRS